MQVHQGRTAGDDELFQFLLDGLVFLVDSSSSRISSTTIRRRVLRTMSLALIVAIKARA